MERPTFQDIYLRLAVMMSERSTCERMRVGAVITSIDSRYVYAIGYNGSAAGDKNGCDRHGQDAVGSCGCIHAEANAVVNCRASREAAKIVFCSHLPCVSCFPGDTPVSSPSTIQHAYRRWYEGDLVQVITTDDEFSVTPNHPVLSLGRGFTAAELVREGDYLLHSGGNQGSRPCGADHKNGKTIQQVYETLVASGLTVRSSGARHQFHGDGGADTHVDIVTAHRPLQNSGQAVSQEFFAQPPLSGTDMRGMGLILPGPVERTVGGMRGRDDGSAGLPETLLDDVAVYLVETGESVDGFASFIRCDDGLYREWNTASTQVASTTLSLLAQDAKWTQAIRDRECRDAKAGSKGRGARSSEIAVSKVLHVERYRWAGHVYNLETTGGWYYAGASSIIAHNCAKLLINLGGVQRVIYRNDYRIKDSLDWFERASIKTVHLSGEEA